jgi:hypothetical protein
MTDPPLRTGDDNGLSGDRSDGCRCRPRRRTRLPRQPRASTGSDSFWLRGCCRCNPIPALEIQARPIGSFHEGRQRLAWLEANPVRDATFGLPVTVGDADAPQEAAR